MKAITYERQEHQANEKQEHQAYEKQGHPAGLEELESQEPREQGDTRAPAARATAPLRVAFAGGGTGGHLCPALAVARALLAGAPGSEALFVGSARPLEERIVSRGGFRHVAAVPARRGRGPALLWAQARGAARALRELYRFGPDVVVGLGGFPSVPGVLAARLLGVPVALFEPNAVAGRANRALAPLAAEAWVHWEGTSLRGCRTVRTGTPLGDGVRHAAGLTRAEARARLGLRPERPALLVMGGSQGASALNAWVERALPRLGERAREASFLHVAGTDAAADVLRRAYARAGADAVVASFLDDVGVAYRAADLAVTRAGGATLAELLALGVPGLVVPLPASEGDHQRRNAQAFAATGAGEHVEEADLDDGQLERALAMLRSPGVLEERRERALAAGRPGAAGSAVERLVELAKPRE